MKPLKTEIYITLLDYVLTPVLRDVDEHIRYQPRHEVQNKISSVVFIQMHPIKSLVINNTFFQLAIEQELDGLQ